MSTVQGRVSSEGAGVMVRDELLLTRHGVFYDKTQVRLALTFVPFEYSHLHGYNVFL